MKKRTLGIAGCFLLFGLGSCAGSGSPASSPDDSDSVAAEAPEQVSGPAEDESEETADSTEVPEECAGDGVCVPPGKWVNKLCEGVYQDVALYLFRKDSPWQRMYLTRETDAVNASGGASVAGTLAFDEEVLILRHRGAGKDGIQIGGGSYDALRWNGSCVSLEAAELTERKPPKMKNSRVEWRWISDEMRRGLRKNEEVNETYRARRQECKGATMGSVTKKCEKLDGKLISVIVDHVRSSADIPMPTDKP